MTSTKNDQRQMKFHNMPRRKQVQPKRLKSSDEDQDSDSSGDGSTDEDGKLKNAMNLEKIKLETDNTEDLLDTRENIKVEYSSTPETDSKESQSKSEEKNTNFVKTENSEPGTMTLKKEKCEKSNSEKRPETPPLKRLMRQDPLPLFMCKTGPSPPKKIFRDELYFKTVPFLPTPSMIKHAPTHPRQAILKSKHYSNKLPKHSSQSLPHSHPKTQMEDQPLDLSTKGSHKSNFVTDKKDNSKKAVAKYTNGLFSSGANSSLQSLQRRFGGGIGFRSNRRPMSGILTNIPSSFVQKSYSNTNIFSSNTLSHSPRKQSSPSLIHNLQNSLDNKLEKQEMQDALDEKDQNCNITKTPNEHSESPEKDDRNKYTVHKCSCQKTYSTLYGLSLHLQESGHLPAGVKQSNLMEYPKLVRGQDMWLNQESEQTKRILRCIQCGESFRSLPMLTVHMMQTQHYTKIVTSEHGRRSHKCSVYCDRDIDRECIFKCKVCHSVFSDMEGLANHMIISGHHKKKTQQQYPHPDFRMKSNLKRFLSEEFSNMSSSPHGNSFSDMKPKYSRDGSSPSSTHLSSSPDCDSGLEDSRITCENCEEKIETGNFVEHVRVCLLSRYDSKPLKAQVKTETLENRDKNCSKDQESHEEKSSDTKEEENKPINSDMSELKIEQDESETLEETKENAKDDIIRNPLFFNEDSKVKLDIIDPNSGRDHAKDGSSALQAMESFIQKSFSSKFNYRRGTIKVASDDKGISEAQDRSRDNGKHSPILKLDSYQKYFQYLHENNDSHEQKDCSESNLSSKDDIGKLEKMCEDVKPSKSPLKETQKDEKSERASSVGSEVSGEILSSKYLNVEEEDVKDKKSSNSTSSALDSLSSFVYSQPMTSEHPLDSLQKLLTSTSIPKFIPTRSTKTFEKADSPSLVGPLNLSIKKELSDDEMDMFDLKENFSDLEGSHSSDSDTNTDYRCAACSRHFASKGSYRYHLSRCHLSSVKKYGIKEAFNMSPYIYLPLDHTAKFSKYYEMAQELANKRK